jgi:putative hydrolase of the HAD superfamily
MYEPKGPKFRAVILDFGDVISHPADPEVLSWMAALFQVPVEQFRQTYSKFRLDYDRGSLAADEYWVKVGSASGVLPTPEQITELRKADVAMWSRLNQTVLNWVLDLRSAGYKTAVLSNMHRDMIQHLHSNGEWTSRFDFLTLSAELGTAKPSREIFEHCLNGLGVSASEALFIDDREANIESARNLGIVGIVAPTTAGLVEKLTKIRFHPLPKI